MPNKATAIAIPGGVGMAMLQVVPYGSILLGSKKTHGGVVLNIINYTLTRDGFLMFSQFE